VTSSFDPFRDIRAWKEGLSQAALDALRRYDCVFKRQVQKLGRETFARDPHVAKAVLLEIEGAIGTWDAPPAAPPSEEGGAWSRTNPPKRGKRAKR